jgi:hypothetical protein
LRRKRDDVFIVSDLCDALMRVTGNVAASLMVSIFGCSVTSLTIERYSSGTTRKLAAHPESLSV